MTRTFLLPTLIAGLVAAALLGRAETARALTLEACQSRVVPFGVAIDQASRVLRDMGQQMERWLNMFANPPSSNRQAAQEAHAERLTLVQGRITDLQEELDCWYGQLVENPPPPDDGGVIDPQEELLCKLLARATALMVKLITFDPEAPFQTTRLRPPSPIDERCKEQEAEEES